MKDLSLDILREDLKFQLTFEPDTFDWDHFIETAQRAKRAAAAEKSKIRLFSPDGTPFSMGKEK